MDFLLLRVLLPFKFVLVRGAPRTSHTLELIDQKICWHNYFLTNGELTCSM